MARGIAKVKYERQSGNVSVVDQPNWEFIYTTSTVKDPDWNIGDRVVLPDGREFRYAKSAGVCASGQSVDFVHTGAIPYTLFSAAAAIGDTSVSFVASTHTALAKDELKGGFFISWPAADYDQFRGIIGNDASATDAAITIYLDGPLTVALTAAMAGEAYQNPYSSVQESSNLTLGKGGVPAVYVSAASMYFWLQTKGPVFIAPQSTMTASKEAVGANFRHDGSLEAVATALAVTVAINDTTQYAGYRMIGSYTGNGPLFMLLGCG